MAKKVRYVITEKGIKQITTFCGGWRLNTTQTQVLDYLNHRRRAGLSRQQLMDKLGFGRGTMSGVLEKELASDLRGLLKKGYIVRRYF